MDATAAGSGAAGLAEARDRARHRLHATPWQVNADIPAAELRRSYLPAAGALAPVQRAAGLGQISDRAAFQVIRVAWTLADLGSKPRPGGRECADALALYRGQPVSPHP